MHCNQEKTSTLSRQRPHSVEIPCSAHVQKMGVKNALKVGEREHALYPEFRLGVQRWVSNVYGTLNRTIKKCKFYCKYLLNL